MVLGANVLEEIRRDLILIVIVGMRNVFKQRFHDRFVIVQQILDHVTGIGNFIARVFPQAGVFPEPVQCPGSLPAQLQALFGQQVGNLR